MLRFAPSPTGDMRIGHLRVAILSYLVAQQKQEPFIIRIEDTDSQKNIEGKDTEIMQILEKFALNHESVFHQSEHLHLYQTLAIQLLKENKAFVCTCTAQTLKASKTYSGHCEHKDASDYDTVKTSKEPFVIRLKKPRDTIIYQDLIQGEISTQAHEVDTFVILTSQGLATHEFASACDDMLSAVSMVIREDTHLLDTPKHIHIKKQLGYDLDTIYAHIPSMQEEDISIQWLFEQGFIPDAIINYLLLIGYDKAPKEIFTLPESIAWFDLAKLSTLPVKFDIETMRTINRTHLQGMDDKALSSLFGFADEKIGQLAKVFLAQSATTKELEENILPIFAPKDFSGKWGKEMRTLEAIIQNAPMFYTFEEFKSYSIKTSGLSDEAFSKAFRILLTGAEHGPQLSEIYPLIKAYLLEVAS